MGHIKVHQSNENHTERDPSRTSATCELEAGSCNEDVLDDQDICKWENDPMNPYNWSAKCKAHQMLMIASAAFTTSLGVSILSPAHSQFMEEFEVGSTVAILPLSLYVFALALGPNTRWTTETVGRHPLYIGSVLLGGIFTLGVGLSSTFTAVCAFRFLAGLCFAPPLAIAAGTTNETFKPAARAIPSTLMGYYCGDILRSK